MPALRQPRMVKRGGFSLARFRRRFATAVVAPLRGAGRWVRTRESLRRLVAAPGGVAAALWAQVEVSHRWRRSWRWTFAVVAGYATVVAISLFAVAELTTLFGLDWFRSAELERRCERSALACHIGAGLVFAALPVAAGFLFVLNRMLKRTRRRYVRRARRYPADLVPTAGNIVGRIVGRDDLCDILHEELRDSKDRRPYVIVGGVGTGKTTVLVQLTQVLARRGAVPVPIRLRDAHDGAIDFLEMARRRFTAEAEQWVGSSTDAEQVWRSLRQQGRIVVIADGLEEALADSDVDRERDHAVRAAVAKAHEAGYPLVIASRPHDALTALDAATVKLEPLNEEAALACIAGGGALSDEHRIGRVIETAEVVETPLYMQIARSLNGAGLLASDRRLVGGARLDTRGVDRAELRRRLLERWTQALIGGHLEQTARLPLKEAERGATVDQLAALACVGLANDTLQVTFQMWNESAPGSSLEAAVADSLARRMAPGEPPRVDMQVAASRGARMGLVEPIRDGVRFPHSIMQAYLGSRMIGAAFDDPAYRATALAKPGRELLVALVMYARARSNARYPERRRSESEPHLVEGRMRRRDIAIVLLDAVHDQPDPAKKFDLLSAAIEIAGVERWGAHGTRERHRRAATTLLDVWGANRTHDDSAVEDAKMKVITRLGEAARQAAGAMDRDGDLAPEAPAVPPGPGPYEVLYRICLMDDLYRVRLAAAQEIGSGGDAALLELRECFEALGSGSHADPESPRRHRSVRDPELHAALEPAADAVGATRLREAMSTAVATEERERRAVVQAWILPMLAGTTSEAHMRQHSERLLRCWIEAVRDGIPLSIEAALAQGFKHAANRRLPGDATSGSGNGARPRTDLSQEAVELLPHARFWFSRLTLVQALTLWAMPDDDSEQPGPDGARDYRAIVNRWVARPDEPERHPFVREAAELAVRALRTGELERFLWIDESGVVTTVGSRAARTTPHARRALWIPPSAGWIGLDRRAQQLVADILVLLNLAERGDTAAGREARLWKINRDALPDCLTGRRSDHLKPARTAGIADQIKLGEGCTEHCKVRLCPYPPRGTQPYRVELTEAFCRHQRSGLKFPRRFGRLAGWQQTGPRELRRFWTQMEERARR